MKTLFILPSSLRTELVLEISLSKIINIQIKYLDSNASRLNFKIKIPHQHLDEVLKKMELEDVTQIEATALLIGFIFIKMNNQFKMQVQDFVLNYLVDLEKSFNKIKKYDLEILLDGFDSYERRFKQCQRPSKREAGSIVKRDNTNLDLRFNDSITTVIFNGKEIKFTKKIYLRLKGLYLEIEKRKSKKKKSELSIHGFDCPKYFPKNASWAKEKAQIRDFFRKQLSLVKEIAYVDNNTFRFK